MASEAGRAAEEGEFRRRFFTEFLRDCYTFQENNTDFPRPPGRGLGDLKRRAKDKVLAFLSGKGIVRRPFDLDAHSASLLSTVGRLDGLERAYGLLGDEHSRQLLLDLLRYRILGKRHVKLPLNDGRFWADYNSVDSRFLKERRTFRTCWDWDLNLYEVPAPGGAPLKLHVTPLGILNTFLLEQYAYTKGGQCIRAREGDVVIDGGGCWGDTALYFADLVGPRGRVYSFEFDGENQEVFRRNLALNPHLEGIVRIVPKAMWVESGREISYRTDGPATTLAGPPCDAGGADARVLTLAIDDLAAEEGLDRVDFIKMDIEGSELSALRGAERTLRSFRPTLAISIYHNDEDFVAIPDYIDRLGLGYEFFLDHFTLHHAETVLFARPGAGRA